MTVRLLTFSGEYEIELKGGKPDGVSITNEQFKLTRGKDILVEIKRERQIASEQPAPMSQVAKWQPGPSDNMLPGLIPEPAKFPGIRRWQVETVAPRRNIHQIACSPDGKYLAAVTSTRGLRIYDSKSLALLRGLQSVGFVPVCCLEPR